MTVCIFKLGANCVHCAHAEQDIYQKKLFASAYDVKTVHRAAEMKFEDHYLFSHHLHWQHRH
jgi:hypothetical protein